MLGVYGERGCPCRTYCVVSPHGELLSSCSRQLGACSPVQGAVQGFSSKHKLWVYITQCSHVSGQLGACSPVQGTIQGFSSKDKAWVYIVKGSHMSSCSAGSWALAVQYKAQ